ncbi:MAG: MarR family transcriptional regulator [Bacteroidales bacterium]|nr:MarR family transcriptional regulator [Bacteroidales bacterium]MBN2820421.1 MarR family transcriptional regulator [Bacteroidales bacterium]
MNDEFIQHFREIIRILDREIFYQNQSSCCNGISVAQCHTLLEIEKKKEISVSELADCLSLDKSTVSRTIEGLVNINLVDRIIPKRNRRMALVSLTSGGKKVCDNINYTNNKYIKRLLDNFSESEREEFLRLLRNFTCNMAEARKGNSCC